MGNNVVERHHKLYFVHIGANTLEGKMIHRYTWRRDDRGEQENLIDYIAVNGRLRKDALDDMMVRGMCEGTDHYAGLAKIRVRGMWEYGIREVKKLARQNGGEKRG